jgi:type IV secretion system protein VirD4
MAQKNRYYHRVLGKNLYVSNDTRMTMLNNNDLIIGSSGSSKTGSVVFAQLKSLRDSSLVVVDTKGRLCRMFRKELEKKGYEVLELDFVNPENSCIYNPLDYIRRYENGCAREQDITKLSAALISDETDTRERFWPMSARGYLDFFVAYTLAALPEEDHNMYTVAKLYRSYTQAYGELPFLEWLENNSESFAAIRHREMQASKNADKMTSSIYGFLNLALFPFDVAEYHHIFDPAFAVREDGTKKKILDIGSMGEKKTVLFLNISDTDHSCDLLVNLFYTQCLQTLITKADENPDGQLKVPVRIMMDDFASGTIIPDFDKIISVVRSRDVWITMCAQSFTQLESLYSRQQAMTIINNCDHIIYLGSNDLGSAEFIGTRAKKTPEMVLAMDRTKEYVLEGGKPAILIDKIPPYSYTEDCEAV